MAGALPSADLIKLHETEHPGVTDQGKSKPHQESGREKQSAKGSRNCFGGWPLATVRPFHRQHSIDSWRAIVARRRSPLGYIRHPAIWCIRLAGNPDASTQTWRCRSKPRLRRSSTLAHYLDRPHTASANRQLRTRVSYDAPRVWDNADPSSRI
jgi:hypothetical protein